MYHNDKILFITSEYPPITSPTALAASFVIDEMAKKKDVYCLRVYGDSETNKEKVRVFSLLKNGRKTVRATNRISKIFDTILFRLRQIVLIPIYPIAHPFLQKRLNETATKLCKEYHIDTVICVSFPFESVVAGNDIKNKLPQIQFVPYLIDAYACGTPPKYLPRKYSNWRREAYEKKMLSNADMIIAMESGKSYYERKGYAENIKYLNPAFFVDNMFSSSFDKNDSAISNNEIITIVYSGYLYLPDRDPTFIIRALSSVPKYKFRLQFVGRSEVNNIIEKEKKEVDYEISCSGHVEHDELNKILNNADIFLHLGVSNSNAISGKIFEYMSYGKPIIALYFDDDEAALPYLKKYPLSCCINTRKTSFTEAGKIISDFIKSCNGKTISLKEVKELFYTSTTGAFVHEIEMLMDEA